MSLLKLIQMKDIYTLGPPPIASFRYKSPFNCGLAEGATCREVARTQM